MKTLFLVTLLILLTSSLYSAIINVPADQSTIQAGITAATNTDTVLVQPGTYVENIDYNGKNITVSSLFLTTRDTTYISSTIIDGNSSGSVVTFESGEDSTAVLSGFKIINGQGSIGGGIYCSISNPRLEYLIVTGNSVNGYGGGIECASCDNLSLSNVTIANNTANSGGGLDIYYSSVNFENVTLTGNSSNNGGGIYCEDSDVAITNSILWNDPTQEIFLESGSVAITYSDIQGGWAGIGNFDSDPLFVNSAIGNYSLQDHSPCIDAGDPSSPLDPDGTNADIGAYYHQYSGPVWHVATSGSDVNGSGAEQNPFATIQYGINFSSDTDTVLVHPGTYNENIIFNGKLITVASMYLTTADTSYISSTIVSAVLSDIVTYLRYGFEPQ